MKRILIILSLFVYPVLFTTGASAKDDKESFKEIAAQWFSAWELVCDFYEVDSIMPVDFVFFDEQYVYSTSTVTISKGSPIKGPDLMNLKLDWKRAPHHGTLVLPDSSTVPVGIMSFAAENKHGNRPFFVMPLPSFWATAGVDSKELGLSKLVTGIFVHEFSHTQQMQNFGKKITFYEQQQQFSEAFDDDIVQNIFKQDSVYTGLYHKEVTYLYDALKDATLDPARLNYGLQLMEQRQQQFFKGKYSALKEIEALFLTMEGLGQYSMYVWLTHPSGGNIDKETAISGVRRNKKWWSQDEGLVLFLLLEKFQHPKHWAKDMFGENVVNVTELLSRAVN